MNALALAKTPAFSAASLAIDPKAETERIVTALRRQVRQTLKKRGLVLGLSGGIDSSVCAALAARAFGPENVFTIFMPENDSDPDSLQTRPHGGGDLRDRQRSREYRADARCHGLLSPARRLHPATRAGLW